MLNFWCFRSLAYYIVKFKQNNLYSKSCLFFRVSCQSCLLVIWFYKYMNHFLVYIRNNVLQTYEKYYHVTCDNFFFFLMQGKINNVILLYI